MTAALDAHKERLRRERGDLDGWSLLELALTTEAISSLCPSGDGPGTRTDALRIAGALATMAAEKAHEASWSRRDIVILARRCLILSGEGEEADVVKLRFEQTWKVEPVDPSFMLSGRTGLRFVFPK